ncbi:MAG TPA: class I adenylate-forming enzyme family protein, partial [Gammaproteobacteria bacterium]
MRQAKADAPQVLGGRAPVDCLGFARRVHALRAVADLHPAKRWALVCDDAGWFGAGLLALAARGRSVVLPQSPQAGSLAGTGVEAVLTDRAADFKDFETLAVREPAADFHPGLTEPDDQARVEFYTSGSSGVPKCVPKAFRQLRLEVEALERQWGAGLADAAVLGTVPHHHLYGLLFRVLWPLRTGRPFAAELCLQAGELRATAAGRRCVVVSSPAFLSRLPDYSELPTSDQVAGLFSSGAPLPDAVAQGLGETWGRAAVEVYGSTETGGVAWRAWEDAADRPWWTPIQGVSTEIREEEAGARLWVRSGCTYQQDWMPAGDLARVGSEGRFTLLGRADDVLKFEDKRVSLGEMRARLLQHPWVAEARLLLLPGRREHIGAVVILKPERRGSERRELREVLRA